MKMILWAILPLWLIKIIVNNPTLKGDSYFTVVDSKTQWGDEVSNDDQHEIFRQTPRIDSNTSGKVVISNSSDNVQENRSENISDLIAGFLALKSFVMDELCSINVNLGRAWTEQCDQTKYLEENNKNTCDDIAIKNMIIKMLSENLYKITNSFYNSNDSVFFIKRQQNVSFVYPYWNNSKNPVTQINSDTITSPNRFSSLQNYEVSKSKDNNNENTTTKFEYNSSTNSTFKWKSPNKRPPVVINQFPENQTDFTRFCIWQKTSQ